MEQQEQVEWDDMNKLLQHHGFKPVYFADPVENKNLSDLVLLDKKSAGEIRMTLRIMLTDSERRQALIQELIKSNNQLKEEVQENMSRAALQSQRATELEGLLDGVKTRVQDLEDRCLGKAAQKHRETQQLQQEKQDAQRQCHVLKQKLSKQKEEATQLQRKLYFTMKEEERRLAQQSQTFQHICKKVSQQNSATDQQLLNVIDFYETKMTQLLNELRSVTGESGDQTRSKTSSNVTPAFKTILKAFQEQQKESEAQIEELKRELETRPTLKEVKYYKHKVRCLEGLNKSNNTSLPKDDDTAEICKLEAGNISDQAGEATVCAQYYHLLNEISAILTDPNAPLQLRRHTTPCVAPEPVECQALLNTLEAWAQQLHLLKDLQHSLNKLTARLMPWQQWDGGHNAAEAVKVEDMVLLVDTLLENASADDEKVLRSPTRYTLGSMVSHFQKLFDVTSLSGVYPRMNEVYTRLGELTNAMRNLRDVLELDSRVPPSEVVNTVARLVSSTEDTAGLQNLLGDDIDRFIDIYIYI
ncbi:hypothetical protein PAMA_014190 [Pampus argenteus]